MTEEYDYAFTGLSKDNKDKLFKGVAIFFETVFNHNNDIKLIRSSPSETSYSSKDIDKCLVELVGEYQINPNKFKNAGRNLLRLMIEKDLEYLKSAAINMNKGDLFYVYKEVFGREFDFERKELEFE